MYGAVDEPTSVIDHDGVSIALVPLEYEDAPARLLLEDYNRLAEAGVSGRWGLYNVRGKAHVWCGTRRLGDFAKVARLIMGADACHRVGYNTGDRLNLRRDNLWIKYRSPRQTRPPWE